jgi:hypothetical protein
MLTIRVCQQRGRAIDEWTMGRPRMRKRTPDTAEKKRGQSARGPVNRQKRCPIGRVAVGGWSAIAQENLIERLNAAAFERRPARAREEGGPGEKGEKARALAGASKLAHCLALQGMPACRRALLLGAGLIGGWYAAGEGQTAPSSRRVRDRYGSARGSRRG